MVVEVDILRRMAEVARARREGVRSWVEVVVGDAQRMPFRDYAFDVVIGEFVTGLLG